jgi:hypothetical protein
MKRLTKQELNNIKQLAKSKDWEATVALLNYRISETLENYTVCSSDHRYVQGKLNALTSLMADIVDKIEN